MSYQIARAQPVAFLRCYPNWKTGGYNQPSSASIHAMPLFLDDLSLNGNQLLDACLQTLPAPPSSPTRGSIYFDTTLNLARIYDGSGWINIQQVPAVQQVLLVGTKDPPVIVEPALTAPGTTPARSMAGYSKATYQVVVSGIGTNVVVAVEGSLDGTNWTNVDWSDPTDSGTVLTANKPYMFATPDIKVAYLRFNFRSFSGGNPTLAVSLMMGN